MEISDRVASLHAALPEFEEAISELERVAGDFLTGPGRMDCLHAFEQDPEAFRFLVEKTLKRRDARSLLGLFVRIVKDEHAGVSARLHREPSSAPHPASLEPATAAELLEQQPHVGDWLRRIGVHYADDPRVFREELRTAKGITTPALVEELRIATLAGREESRART